MLFAGRTLRFHFSALVLILFHEICEFSSELSHEAFKQLSIAIQPLKENFSASLDVINSDL